MSTEYANLRNIFAKYCTTKALHFLCTATFFPDGISVQVHPNKTDLTAVSKRYLFSKNDRSNLQRRKKLANKKRIILLAQKKL